MANVPPSDPAGKRPLARRTQFSLRSLLGLTAIVALSAGYWKAFIDEPPTHRFPAYEKAPSTQGLTIRVGPNTISLRSVARNDSSGIVHFETGDGKPLKGTVPGGSLMANCANWLDVVQFEFESTPSDFEVIEARVFEHQSRSLLSQIDPAFGWRMVAPNLLQVYGLGKELPERLDIWLRANSYRSDDKASIVRLQAGKKQPVSGGVILLKAVQSGFEGWSSRSGFLPVKEVDASITALDLLWIAPPQSPEPFQVAAVSIDGQKQVNDTYLSWGGNSDQRTVAMFDFPIDEISHLEIRLHGGRHRFFFDGAKVPKVAGRFFAPAPLVTVPVEQREVKTVVAELAPLKVAITVGNGDQVTGSRANETVSRVLRRVIPENVWKAFSVISDVEGIAAIPLAVRLIDSQNGVIVTSPMGMHRAANATSSSSSETFPLSLQLVEAIEVSLQP